MTRILIVGPKDRLEGIIDLLYRLESVHLIDFEAGEGGIGLGAPLPSASATSERLLKLRAVEKDLEVKEPEVSEKLPVERIKKELDSALTTLEKETSGVVVTKNRIQHRLSELDARRRELEPFIDLGLDLDLYRGYKSLVVFVGQSRLDPEGVLGEALKDFEAIRSKSGRYLALFVRKEQAEEAQRILTQHGFNEIPIPKEDGVPERIMKEIEEEASALRENLDEVTERLSQLREKHAQFILAAEEEMAIEVEKAEAPLRLGTTDHAFVLDAWVPQTQVSTLQGRLHDEFGRNIYLEIIETKSRREKEHEEEKEEKETPVKLRNPGPVRLFEYLIELISVPRYNEIDPTSFVSIFFPLFFGLMVGDVGYAIPFLILGYLGLRKCTSNEWRTIATMLFYGGIFAFIFGLFLFGEALGMHFAPTGHEGDITWSGLLGVELPHEISIGGLAIPLGLFSKLHDVKILLYISVWIGIVHLYFGYILGFANVAMRHGFKHAFMEKFSWLLMLTGGVLVGLELMDVLILGNEMNLTGFKLLGGVGLLIPGILIGLKGEGGSAILELPSLASNVFSYTRLTAIGMSKAGMALAFNQIAITMIAPSGGIMIAIAFLIFAFGHMMIFILAIISAGLHGIRLQYVEFFTKFYEGGGLTFNPLKIVRKYTEV